MTAKELQLIQEYASPVNGEISEAMSDYVPLSELPGLDMRFRAEIAKLL